MGRPVAPVICAPWPPNQAPRGRYRGRNARPGPSQRGVEVVGTIRGPDHNDSLPARVFHREGVHTGQELFVLSSATGGFRM